MLSIENFAGEGVAPMQPNEQIDKPSTAPLKFLARMRQRLATARIDCDDTTLFLELMYLGEFALKVMVSGMIASLEDDRDRHRYRLEYGLVRADGIGEWAKALDDLLTGPAAVTAASAVATERAELTKNFDMRSEGAWQANAIRAMLDACHVVDPEYAKTDSNRVALRMWFRHFAWLRNKTRGHGATTAGASAKIAESLELSLNFVIDNFSLFQREWAYLHRNLSGKYRVSQISGDVSSLDHLKRQNDTNLPDGVYIVFDGSPRIVRLLHADVELNDFFVCNGGYGSETFEALSYITDTRKVLPASEYQSPPMQLPESETGGLGSLEPQGRIFGNLPPRRSDYIDRPTLEETLMRTLMNDRHAIVTLVGRGGTGKTSLALEVLHQLACREDISARFYSMLWFSARDVDLTDRGPKIVRPRVLTIGDIAEQFVDLMGPSAAAEKGFKKDRYLAGQLTKSDVGALLYVFDNFETVRDPQEMFDWLDTFVRPPNKILITTRLRDFKGDYPVEVGGMRRVEFDKLVDATAIRLEVVERVDAQYRGQLFDQSDGHPYIAKLLIGDLANDGRKINPTQLVAGKDDVLQALFERTFGQLSPLAQRLFLTLCGWRSAVPRIALEAALLRVAEEPLDTGRAVDHLIRSSLVDSTATMGGDEFLAVPLAASLFGRKKLQVSPLQNSIKADLEFLQMFGATRESDVAHGLTPRLRRLFRSVAEKVQTDGGSSSLSSYLPVLEHIARRHAPAWLLLADLHEEQQGDGGMKFAEESIRHYLEECPYDHEAWSRLAALCRKQRDAAGEAQALVSGSTQSGASFEMASEAAWRINTMLKNRELSDVADDELSILVRALLDRLDADRHLATATDFSRMAWLAVNIKDNAAVAKYVRNGIDRDADNFHLKKLRAWVDIESE